MLHQNLGFHYRFLNYKLIGVNAQNTEMALQKRTRIGHEFKKNFGAKIFSFLMNYKSKKLQTENLEELNNLINFYTTIDKDFVDFTISKYETKIGVTFRDAFKNKRRKMKNALHFASWFVQNSSNTRLDTPLDLRILLNQLFFAQMIHLAVSKRPLYREPLYAIDAGMTIKHIEQSYKTNVATLYTMKLPHFTKSQSKTLKMTLEIYGDVDVYEMIELVKYFDCWQKSSQNIKSTVVPIEALHKDLPIIQRVIDGYKSCRKLKSIEEIYTQEINKEKNKKRCCKEK